MKQYVGSQLVRLRDPENLPYRQAKAKRKKNRQLGILQSLPGIGPDRAKRLLERFGSVRACFGASTKDLLEVEGIGPRIAARGTARGQTCVAPAGSREAARYGLQFEISQVLIEMFHRRV